MHVTRIFSGDDGESHFEDVEIPLTEQYLIANCPDQGTLGGNDEVGE